LAAKSILQTLSNLLSRDRLKVGRFEDIVDDGGIALELFRSQRSTHDDGDTAGSVVGGSCAELYRKKVWRVSGPGAVTTRQALQTAGG
jgi:hypothetical protein